MIFKSIQSKIIFFVITILFIGVFLLLGVTKYSLSNVIDKKIISYDLDRIEKDYVDKIDSVFKDVITLSLELADRPLLQEFLKNEDKNPKLLPEFIKDCFSYMKKFYNFSVIYMVNDKNKNYYTQDGFIKTIDIKNSENYWYSKTLNSNKKYTINVDSAVLGELNLWIDTIVGDVAKPLGLAGVGINISQINSIIESINIENNTKAYLVDKEFIIKSSKNKNHINKNFYSINNHKNIKKNIDELISENRHYFPHKDSKGRDEYLFLFKLKNIDWYLIVDMPKSGLMDRYDETIYLIEVFEIGFLILFIAILYIMLRVYIFNPLNKISLALKDFSPEKGIDKNIFLAHGVEFERIGEAILKSSNMVKESYSEMKNSKEMLDNVTNAVNDVIFYKDKDLNYIGCNNAYAKLKNLSKKEIIGKHSSELIDVNSITEINDTDTQTLKGVNITYNKWFIYPNGKETYFHIKKTPLRDSNGKICGIVGIGRDITTLKELQDGLEQFNKHLEYIVAKKTNELHKTNRLLREKIKEINETNKELKEAKDEAESALKAKSIFISNVSHELRTPLNAIINFTDQVIEDFDEIMVDGELQIEAKEFLERSLKNSKHLLALINDILEFSKIEAGKLHYHFEDVKLNNIVKLAYENSKSLIENKEIDFKLNLPNNIIYAHLDKRRFLQILLNLLSNAIKFTKDGFVEVRLLEDEKSIIVEVEDSGKGIPIDKIDLIFKPFEQIDKFENGTGLGLAITKKICENMKIDLDVKTKEKGSIFIVKIKK